VAAPDLIAAYCTGAAGIITAIGGVLVGILGTRRARDAAAQAAATAVQPVTRKMDEVGKQIGQHTYEVRDRMNTESSKSDAIQRQVETLVANQSSKPSEQSVWNYIRQAKASQNEAQLAAAQAQHALEQVQLMLGQTPTIRQPVQPLTGPVPPPVPKLGDD
jgi:hypothetical protein